MRAFIYQWVVVRALVHQCMRMCVRMFMFESAHSFILIHIVSVVGHALPPSNHIHPQVPQARPCSTDRRCQRALTSSQCLGCQEAGVRETAERVEGPPGSCMGGLRDGEPPV